MDRKRLYEQIKSIEGLLTFDPVTGEPNNLESATKSVQKKARLDSYKKQKAAEEVSKVLDYSEVENEETNDEADIGNGEKYESITDLDYSIMACLRYAKSENGIFFILNSVLLDVKIALEKGKSLDSIWKGRSTIQNKLKKLFANKIEKHVEYF